MNDLVVGMNTALNTTARRFGFMFVDTDSLFEGYRLCDNVETPYFQYDLLSIPGVFHPTDIGHQQLFRALQSGAGCSF